MATFTSGTPTTSPLSSPSKSQSCQVDSLCAPAHSTRTTQGGVSLQPLLVLHQPAAAKGMGSAMHHLSNFQIKLHMLHFKLCSLSHLLLNHAILSVAANIKLATAAVRTAKFVARKQWIVCGSDDMFVRVYNYNTMDKVKAFEAHTDYIRSIAVHPTQPYLLTCSDDMLIKLWDWDKVCLGT